jgi:hypothetical protein
MNKDTPRELAHDEGKEIPVLIASIPAGVQQRGSALGIVIFFSVAFALVIPFAPRQVGRVDAFIPVVQSIICVTDLITAVLLFAQYRSNPSAPFSLSQAAIYAAACSHFCKHSNFLAPIARPAVCSAVDRAVQRGSLIFGA